MPRYRNITGITFPHYRDHCLASAAPWRAELCNLSHLASKPVLEFTCTETEEIEHFDEYEDAWLISEIDITWEIKLNKIEIGTITVKRSTCLETKQETVHTLEATLNMDRETVMESMHGLSPEFDDFEYKNEKEFRVEGHWYNGNMIGAGFWHHRITDYENVDKAFYALITWVARSVTRQILADYRILEKHVSDTAVSDADFFDLETPI